MLHLINQVCRIYETGAVVLFCMFSCWVGNRYRQRGKCLLNVILRPLHHAVTEQKVKERKIERKEDKRKESKKETNDNKKYRKERRIKNNDAKTETNKDRKSDRKTKRKKEKRNKSSLVNSKTKHFRTKARSGGFPVQRQRLKQTKVAHD